MLLQIGFIHYSWIYGMKNTSPVTGKRVVLLDTKEGGSQQL
jgi:hypothetical protein